MSYSSLGGYSVAPGGSMGGSPSDAIGSMAAMFNAGGLPNTPNLAYAMSNDFIQRQYVNNPWNDGAHMNIAEYQLVFAARNLSNHEMDMYTAVSVAKINEILRNAYIVFAEAVAKGDTDAVRFATLLDTYGENLLENYHKLVKAGMENVVEGTEMAEFYRMAMQPVFRYMTKLGIMSYWNFLGVTLNVNRATELDESSMQEREEHVSVINTVLAKRAVTHNVVGAQGDLPTGSDCWLVLYRRKRKDGTAGHFEIITYGSRERMSVPRRMAYYRDGPNRGPSPPEYQEREVSSLVIPLGVVTEPPARDAPAGMRDMAMGLDCKHRQAYEAVASLPTMRLQLGM